MSVSHHRFSTEQVAEQLRDLGVCVGAVLVVHTSFRAVGPIESGPVGLIGALRAVLGSGGTLVMPSMTGGDQPYDPETTPTDGMGIVAETFWRMPGVLRGDHPTSTFAAVGPEAAEIAAPQPLSPAHGLDSPVGRVYERDGQVLLLGVDHSSNTMIHLAEALADVPYRTVEDAIVMSDGRPERITYWETNHCCRHFTLVGEWLRQAGLQREGRVGHARAMLMDARAVIEVATSRLREQPTLFLCPEGSCDDCDRAWASIPSTAA